MKNRFDVNTALRRVARAAALILALSAAHAQVASNPPPPSYAPNSLATVVKEGVLQWNLWGPGLTNGPGLNGDDNNNFADLAPIVQGTGVAAYGQPATIFTNIPQGPRNDTDAVLGDAYCDQFIGVFIPPATTNYTFFVCSDDYSQLYLSTDIGASDARLIAQEDGWSNPNQWTASAGGSTLASKRSDQFIPFGGTAPAYSNGIPMVAGQMYFIELAHENGVGGYNDSVTYKFAGAPDPANGTQTIIGPSNLGFVAQPPSYVNVTITPSNETVYAGGEASFSASVTSDATPYMPTYQWQKNGVNITNADGAVADGPLYTTIVTSDNNGDTFQCVATYPGVTNSYASAPATIAVLPGAFVSGGLKQEFWANTGSLSGLMAGNLSAPTSVAALTNFECPVNTGLSNYNQRVSGWFIPPATGKYVFFVESDDAGDLFLSTDSTKANMRLICQETGWADSLEWMTDEDGGVTSGAAITQKRSDQWSPDGGLTVPYASGIPLVAGTPYYIEGDMEQLGGGDNFAATFKLTTQDDPANGQAPALSGTDIAYETSPAMPQTVVSVSAKANIFGAGLAIPPDPGGPAQLNDGYGGGILPVAVPLPFGSKIATFSASGLISYYYAYPLNYPFTGPDGGSFSYQGITFSQTSLASFGGISGIIGDGIGFLVGVFLGSSGQPSSASAVLDFSSDGIGTTFTDLAPALGQTFFIGDGLTGTGSGSIQQFTIPNGSTALYLGFVDGSSLNGNGLPGHYDDNFGALSVDVTFAAPAPAVSLISPSNGARFSDAAAIGITASVIDRASLVTNVQFYANDLLLGSQSSPPYSAIWSNAPIGSYFLTVVAYANDGVSATSAPVNIAVTLPFKLFNTGVDDCGSLLPPGAIDPHYSLIGSADSNAPIPNAYVLDRAYMDSLAASEYHITNKDLFPNGPDSEWIGPSTSERGSSASGIYIYRTTFDLSGYDARLTSISGLWLMDDFGVGINLNGRATSVAPTSNGVTNRAFFPFTITNGFSSGLNTLDFVVTNVVFPPYDPTTLRVELSGTSVPLGGLPPAIVQQPVSIATNEGADVSFSIVATGTAPLSYQWQLNGSDLPGATNATCTLTNVQTSQAGFYSAVLTNEEARAVSCEAVLTVATVFVPPSITQQPANITTNQGANAVFSVVATGTAPLAYQWWFNGTSLPGATGSSLTLANVQRAENGTYWVIVSNAAGSATSSNALLTVIPPATAPPSIYQQPASLIVSQGSPATFTVGATGSPPLSYQWLFGTASLPGQTAAPLSLPSTGMTSIGYYSVMVSNSAGPINSTNASLTFLDPKIYAGITLAGPAGGSYAIQALPSVGATNWTTLTNVTLGTQSYFYIDSRPATNGTQFYRAISPP